MIHHTAGSETLTSEPSQASFIKTKGDSPPLAQIMLGQSGTVWITAAPRSGQKEPGRASHAGLGGPAFGMSQNDANSQSLGIEVHCAGTHPIKTAHPAQYKILIDLVAALCKRYGLTEKNVLGHKEWAPNRKIDPKDNMNTFRADVKAALGGTVTPPPITPPPIQIEDDMPAIMKRKSNGSLAVTDGVWKWRIGSNTPAHVAKLFPGIKTVVIDDWYWDAVPDAGSAEYRIERYLDSKNSETLGIVREIKEDVDALSSRPGIPGVVPDHTHGGVE